MTNNTERVANIFKALCDKNRVAIVQLLQSGEKCACNIGEELGLAQSKLSYHMKILCTSGIVECRYVGKWTHYKISQEGGKDAVDILTALMEVKQDEDGCACEQAV